MQARAIGRKGIYLSRYFFSTSAKTLSTCNNDLLTEEIRQANARYKGRVLIRRMDNDTVGWGLESLCNFSAGDVVIKARAMEIWDRPNSHTIQKDWDRHVMMDLPARFLNHQCNSANLGVQDNELGAYDFVALRKIVKGEHLTWDYHDAEYYMESPFICQCEDANCRELVKGWKHSDDAAHDNNHEYLPLYRLNHDDWDERTSSS